MNFQELEDLNFDIANLQWKQLSRTSKNRVPAILEGVLRLIYWTSRSIKFRKWNKNQSDIVFIIATKNQARSLLPVASHIQSSIIITVHRETGHGVHIPEFYFYVKGLRKILTLWRLYREARSPYHRWSIRKRLDRYVLALSAVDAWIKYLSGLKPKILVLSNDHSVWTRSALKAARYLDIKTAFIPHAPIGISPPKLEFDYAFLDGSHQAEQFSNENKKIILSGAIRYESLVSNHDSFGYGVLICFNKMDSIEFVEKIIRRATVWNIPCRIRPHPADENRYSQFRKLSGQYGMEFVPGDVSFLSAKIGMRYVLAGISGVHVDGLMAGMIPITFSDWYIGDYYRLKENGVLHVLTASSSLPGTNQDSCTNDIAKSLNHHISEPALQPSKVVAAIINKIVQDQVSLDKVTEILFDDFSVTKNGNYFVTKGKYAGT